MANYLLDSTIIIDCLRGKKGSDELLKKLALEGSTLGCCSVNIVEVYTGMKDKEREKTANLLNSFEYYNITREIATLAGQYRRNYRKKGNILSVSDVLIGVVAILYNLVFITDNIKHYPMPEIKFFKP